MKSIIFFLFILPVFCSCVSAQSLSVGYSFHPEYFPLVNGSRASTLFVDPSDFKVVDIAAKALQEDMADISGRQPALSYSTTRLSATPILIGTAGHSKWIDSLIATKKINIEPIRNKWEAFTLQVIKQPFKQVAQAMVIVGSDRRGTAYGVFELSKRMGISPWKWWADVHPAKHGSLYLSPGRMASGSPSVKYRGIFINDEDWGLQPWAARNMDTAIRDIGPHTYARVFELLLRLKANFIWPAMHPCTRAFYFYPQNPQLADDYAIVVGSSHAEPMLRNNVFEWAVNFENEYHKKPGEWRYDVNGSQILQYWKDRVEESRGRESIYTIGMRGIHDGAMPGPKPMPEKVRLLQKVISDQRALLSHVFQQPVTTVPQIFCPYKEVLDIYRSGLSLPDDVTIVWSDDNHGYIRQLSNESEQRRKGASGIYYHLSYWGSPHDYLWLSSVSPALISYEMTKAYAYGANRLWVFNVGDIKPAEMEIEFAMDLAWNKDQWPPAKAYRYARYWAEKTFGKEYAGRIAAIKNTYYQLAASGKPEHLALVSFAREQETQRLRSYRLIAEEAEALKAEIPARLQDAFFETIYYPVVSAGLMNEKILCARKSLDPGISPDSAHYFAAIAEQAFGQIQELTDQYNRGIAGGKWNGIMSWHPRDLPVFYLPGLADERYLDSLKKHPPLPASGTGTDTRAILLNAADFSFKKETDGTRFQVIPGLGINGKGVSTLPFKRPSKLPMPRSSFLEYKVELSPGLHTITVNCLPTQSIDADQQLHLGISVNGQPVRVLNIHSESESRQWKENVLRGYASASITCTTDRKAVVRIYFPDPGLVINTIEIR